MHAQQFIPVSDSSQVGEARRAAAKIAETTELNATERGRVAIVVTELATNIVRHCHPHGGHVLLRAVDATTLEVIAVDRGRGMDAAQCMRDGYSTTGTAGQGLGAIQRQSTHFDVYSSPAGTVIRAEIATADSQRERRLPLPFGIVQTPAPNETLCGDGWRMVHEGTKISLMVIDGLGHGLHAAEAAQAASQAFDEDPFADPESLLHRCHRKLASTRGAAVATASIDGVAKTLRYAGVGNIGGTLLTGAQTRGMMSHNGTLGHQVRKIQAMDFDWSPEQSTLVMQSDGVQSRWTLDSYPGLLARHPALLAAVLHRDFIRGRDDATVAVVRSPKAGGA